MAPVLVQEAASDSKLIALFPPACPGPTALFGRAVRGRLSPRKPPTTSPVPKQGRRGFACPSGQTPVLHPKPVPEP